MSDSHSKSKVKQNVMFTVLSSLAVCTFFYSPAALASNFSISPTSLELSSVIKSTALSVINHSDEKLNCQVSVKEWTQTARGEDVYKDTTDIVFFPKIMTIEPQEQRAIRVGIKGPPPREEQSYRIFVEEIPSPRKENAPKEKGKIAAGLTIALRFATPIFIKPLQPKEGGGIEKIEMAKGSVKAVIANTGNVHFKLQSISFLGKASDGKAVFAKDITGWYVLHGQRRAYEVAVPPDLCSQLATIEVKVQSESSSLNGSLDVQKAMCGR